MTQGFTRAGKRRVVIGALLAGLGLGVAAQIGSCKGGDATARANGGALDVEAQWGVRVLGVRRAASGYMLDLRYQVVDVDKSAHVLGRGIEPRLVVAKNGAALEVPSAPKIGKLRQSAGEAQRDRVYFALFANPGRLVEAGDEVTLFMGDLELPHIQVE